MAAHIILSNLSQQREHNVNNHTWNRSHGKHSIEFYWTVINWLYRKCDKNATIQWRANWCAKMRLRNDKTHNLCHQLDEIRTNFLFQAVCNDEKWNKHLKWQLKEKNDLEFFLMEQIVRL